MNEISVISHKTFPQRQRPTERETGWQKSSVPLFTDHYISKWIVKSHPKLSRLKEMGGQADSKHRSGCGESLMGEQTHKKRRGWFSFPEWNLTPVGLGWARSSAMQRWGRGLRRGEEDFPISLWKARSPLLSFRLNLYLLCCPPSSRLICRPAS